MHVFNGKASYLFEDGQATNKVWLKPLIGKIARHAGIRICLILLTLMHVLTYKPFKKLHVVFSRKVIIQSDVVDC